MDKNRSERNYFTILFTLADPPLHRKQRTDRWSDVCMSDWGNDEWLDSCVHERMWMFCLLQEIRYIYRWWLNECVELWMNEWMDGTGPRSKCEIFCTLFWNCVPHISNWEFFVVDHGAFLSGRAYTNRLRDKDKSANSPFFLPWSHYVTPIYQMNINM